MNIHDLFTLPCEFGSGKLSRGTRCMTVVFPVGNPRAVKFRVKVNLDK